MFEGRIGGAIAGRDGPSFESAIWLVLLLLGSCFNVERLDSSSASFAKGRFTALAVFIAGAAVRTSSVVFVRVSGLFASGSAFVVRSRNCSFRRTASARRCSAACR